MKNMKKVLSAIASLGLVVTAGVSTIGCAEGRPPYEDQIPYEIMGIDVKKDLGISDYKGSKLSVEIKPSENDPSVPVWVPDSNSMAILEGLSASNLLFANNKAKSQESSDFLKNALSLKDTNGVFDRKEAEKIFLHLGDNITLELKGNNNDYIWPMGGNMDGYWYTTTKNNLIDGTNEDIEKICRVSATIMSRHTDDKSDSPIKKMLNPYWEKNPKDVIKDFNNTAGTLSKFVINGDKNNLRQDEKISLKDKSDSTSFKWINNFTDNNFLGAAMSFEIGRLERKDSGDNSPLKVGDKLHFAVYLYNGFGGVDFRDKFYFEL